MADERSTESPSPPVGTAPYAAPKLVVYGSLADITRATGKTSNMDGGTGQMSKSQV